MKRKNNWKICPSLPKGWRYLDRSDIIKSGDLYWNRMWNRWKKSTFEGCGAGFVHMYIRKVK